MRMGGGPQQFGVDVEQVPALLEELSTYDVTLEGFHVFAGSQNLQTEILMDAQRQTVQLLLELAVKCPEEITYLNLGGGFGIPYFDRDQRLDLACGRREPARTSWRTRSAQPIRGRGW